VIAGRLITSRTLARSGTRQSGAAVRCAAVCTRGDRSANLDTALEMYEAAAEHLRGHREIECVDLLGNVLGNLCGAYLARDDTDRAIDAAQEALRYQDALRRIPG
jgi:surface antigen